MKQILVIAGLGLALTGCMTDYGWSEAPLDDRHYAQGIPVDWWGRDVASVDIFFGSLAQYGTWGNHSRYGRVFLPMGVGPGWQPYSRGYWRNDPRFGRMFVSQDPWGWATYHYGRWGRDSRFGWFWVPDTRFGPSWVDWRTGGGFASWSPLPPPGWSSWGNSWGNDWWVHAPGAWIYRPGLQNHVRRGPHGWDGRRDWDRNRDWQRNRDRDGDRDRDRDGDRDGDRGRDWVDRGRPGGSSMPGFVRGRGPQEAAAPTAPAEQPAAVRPAQGWTGQRSGARPPRDDWRGRARAERGGEGEAAGGFVRNRGPREGAVRRDAAPAMVAPPRAVPADARVAPPRPTYSAERAQPPRAERAPPQRAERAPPQRAERPTRSYEAATSRGGRDYSQRLSED